MTTSQLLMPKLPAGFSTRPVDPDADSPAVTALCEAIAIGEYGVSDVNLQAVRESYNAPGFDPQTDARVVFDARGRLIGVAEFYDLDGLHVAPFVYVRVLPSTCRPGSAPVCWNGPRSEVVRLLSSQNLGCGSRCTATPPASMKECSTFSGLRAGTGSGPPGRWKLSWRQRHPSHPFRPQC